MRSRSFAFAFSLLNAASKPARALAISACFCSSESFLSAASPLISAWSFWNSAWCLSVASLTRLFSSDSNLAHRPCSSCCSFAVNSRMASSALSWATRAKSRTPSRSRISLRLRLPLPKQSGHSIVFGKAAVESVMNCISFFSGITPHIPQALGTPLGVARRPERLRALESRG